MKKALTSLSPATRRFPRFFWPTIISLLAFVLSSTLYELFPAIHHSQDPREPVLIDGDETWPIRTDQEPWDISTNYPYPRKLEYDVEEGTWLHLTVHPVSGDIVFAIVGDLYCLPAHEYRSGVKTRARPILLGIPHDTEPSFDSDGTRLAFRSDAISGVENIWVLPWHGCSRMDLRPPRLDLATRSLSTALQLQEYEEKLLLQDVPESETRRRNRLIREGRLEAIRVTNETYRWVTSPRFHPSDPSQMVAIRWMTPGLPGSDIGAPEGWLYEVPSFDSDSSIPPRSGSRVVGRTLPLGYGPERYQELHIGPEQFIWFGNDCLIYAKNVKEDFYHYGKDVHEGIYAIHMYNMTSGRTETLVNSFPGGASRPELSRDQKTLAFVRRVRDKEMLVLRDMQTGTLCYIWDGLTYDLSTIHAPHGTYPSFSWSVEDDGLILWSAGQLWSVPLSRNNIGERVSGGSPRVIPFSAHIEKRLADTLHTHVDLVSSETQLQQRIRAFKELRVDESRSRVAFQAAGITMVQGFDKRNATGIPALCPPPACAYHHPSFVPGHPDLLIHARWSNKHLSSFELANISGKGDVVPVIGTPFGKFLAPTVSRHNPRKIAFVKTAGDPLTGDVVATARPGIYVGDLTDFPLQPKVTNLAFITANIDLSIFPANRVTLRFVHDDTALLVEQNTRVFRIDIATGLIHDLAMGKMSMEVAISGTDIGSGTTVAFIDYFNLYTVPASAVKEGEMLWSRPLNATSGLARLSLHGAHDISFSPDGEELFWLYGPEVHSVEVRQLALCADAVRNDNQTFGVDCIDRLVRRKEIFVYHSSDTSRLKAEANVRAARPANADVVVITNATLLTMESGTEKDLIRGGRVIMRGGLIDAVGPQDSVPLPEDAYTIDAHGGFVVPGFIDVHSHWFSCFFTRYPAASWELASFLAYGITTLHNPSAHNVEAFVERSRVERGLTVGPRIFSVGNIVYGSAQMIHQDIVDMQTAVSALDRIKAEGGHYALTYKNYGISSRASRQRLLLAGRNISMLAVPEAGMNYDWDLTYIVDGMTTVEHNLPIPELYSDVAVLFAHSGTGITPTHIINYGGAFGEELVWRQENVNFNDKLRRFIPHATLQGLTETVYRPSNSYSVRNTSQSIARMAQMGLSVHVGAHGEQPVGLNYHAEMAFMASGGLSNIEVLRSATATAAKTLGLFSSIGSLTRGKLADLLIYPPKADLLDDLRRTLDLKYVVRGSRIYEADTLKEIWPVEDRELDLPYLNAG